MAREDVQIILPVVPKLDDRGTSSFWKDIKRLEKDLKKVDIGFKNTAKTASRNVRELNQIAKSAESFEKSLSKGAISSVRELQKLSKQLDKQRKKADKAQAGIQSASTKEDQEKYSDELSMAVVAMSRLNQKIDSSKNSLVKFKSQIENASKAQKKYVNITKSIGQFSKADATKGVYHGVTRAVSGGTGDFKAGLGQVVDSISKGIAGARSRKLQGDFDKAQASGDSKGMNQAMASMQGMGKAMAGLSLAAAGLVAFVKLLSKASSHMTDLNKAMGAGEGFASELGAKTGQYTRTLKEMRDAAIDSHASMLKFGLDSEKSLQIIGAFSKSASGSVIRTAAQLKKLGDGDLQKGLFQMATQAQLYAKALGMEATEVGSMMGDLVSEVGMNSDNVLGIIGDVVKQASQANMPLTKFNDIFRQAVPNLDLFTNRIEEVTGMVKLMSKTMDPKSVKNFMDAFGRGFDQLDFKQRLKMALVVGPGEMGKIMDKDIKRAGESVKKSLPDSLKSAFDDAMSGKGSLTDLAAKASMQGVDGAVVGNIKKLERMKGLSKGGVLKQATAMRDMGMLGRMEALEKYAGKFTGGDITGLGEHVAKKLGVSESEYKAILDLKASMQTQMASLGKYGRTGSKSINDSLARIYKLEGKTPEEFEAAMKELAKTNPQDLEENIKLAATMQLDEQQQQAKDDEKRAATVEQIGIEQVNATMSIGDKIENILGVLLEKLYFIMDEVLQMIGNIYDYLPNFLTGKKSSEAAIKLRGYVRDANEGKYDKDLSGAGKKQYTQTVKQIASSVEAGADNSKLINTFMDPLTKAMSKGEGEVRKLMGDLAPSKDVEKFISDWQQGKGEETTKFLKEMDTDKLAELLGRAAFSAAKDVKDNESQYGKKEASKTDLKTKAMFEAERKGGDTDLRAVALAGGEIAADAVKGTPAAVAGSPATGTAPSGTETVKASKAVQATAETQEDQKKVSEDQKKVAEDQYAAASDSLSILKKGIRLENSWMESKFKNTMIDAVMKGVTPPITEQTLMYARMWDDEAFRKAISSPDMIDDSKKAGMGNLLRIGGETEENIKTGIHDVAQKVPSFDTGGTVGRTGMAVVHAGEKVVPKNYGKNTTINVVINATTDASPQQIAEEIYRIQNRQLWRK